MRIGAANPVRDARLRLGLTQEELACKFDASVSSVQKWEGARVTPGKPVLGRIRALADGTPAAAQPTVQARIEQLEKDLAELKRMMGELLASSSPSRPSTLEGQISRQIVIEENLRHAQPAKRRRKAG